MNRHLAAKAPQADRPVTLSVPWPGKPPSPGEATTGDHHGPYGGGITIMGWVATTRPVRAHAHYPQGRRPAMSATLSLST